MRTSLLTQLKALLTKSISYKILLLTISTILCFNNKANASKTLELEVTSISWNFSGGNCDCICTGCIFGGGRSQLDVVYDINAEHDLCDIRENDNNHTQTLNFVVKDDTYNRACDWPSSGNYNFNVEFYDRDCLDACILNDFVSVVSNYIDRVDVSVPYPASTFTGTGAILSTSKLNVSVSAGYSTCNNGTLTINYRWKATGSFNTTAVDFDNFCYAWQAGTTNSPGGSNAAHTESLINNDTLDTNETISIPTFDNKGASSQHYCSLNEPNANGNDETVWIKFTTGKNPGSEIEIDLSASNGQYGIGCFGFTTFGKVKVYEADNSPVINCPDPDATVNWFNGLVLTQGYFPRALSFDLFGEHFDLGDNAYFRIECPKPETTYYIQIETYNGTVDFGLFSLDFGCDEADFTLRIRDLGGYSKNDDICDAYPLGVIGHNDLVESGSGGIPAKFSTNCATKQIGEPSVSGESGNQEGSLWFKFTVDDNMGKPAAGAMWEIWAEVESNIEITERINLNLYRDPTGCGTLEDLQKQTNREGEAYYGGGEVGCVAWNIADFWPGGDEPLPRNKIYGCLEPGATYYIQVFVYEGDAISGLDLGLWDEQGDFSIHVKNSRPIPNYNNNFADRKAISPLDNSIKPGNNDYGLPTLLVEENNLCASVESFEIPNTIVTSLEHTVWYSFIAPESGSVQFKLVNSSTSSDPEKDIEEEIIVYENLNYPAAPTTSALNVIYSYSSNKIPIVGGIIEDGNITWDDYAFVTCLNPGQEYYLSVDGGYDGLTGYCPGDAMRGVFDLSLRDYDIWQTPNNFIDSAFDIMATQSAATILAWNTCNTSTTITIDQQDNYCADNGNEAITSPWDQPMESTVWYSFTAPSSGKVRIEILNELDCGLFTSITDSDRKPFIDIRAAVYQLNSPYTLTDMSNNTNANLAFTELASSESGIGISCLLLNRDFEVSCLKPEETYYLVIDGEAGGFTQVNDYKYGEFKIILTSDDRDSPAPNDNICNAIDLGNPTGGSVSTTSWVAPAGVCMSAQNNFCATNTNDPQPQGGFLTGFDADQSVWYSFIAPLSGSVNIYADNNVSGGNGADNIDLAIGVFELVGSSCNTTGDSIVNVKSQYIGAQGITCSGGFCDEELEVHCLEPGEIYYVMIDNGNSFIDLGLEEGYFELTISEIANTQNTPPHDTICGARDVTSLFSTSLTILGDSNRCADVEYLKLSDPSTFSRDHTVWYTFLTPSIGTEYSVKVKAQIEYTTFLGLPIPDILSDWVDPQLALYESNTNDCNGVITEKYSDYSILDYPFTETTEFHCLEPSTRYWLMFDGSAINSQGNFDITFENITPLPIPLNNDRCDVIDASTGDLGTLGPNLNDSIGGLGSSNTLWYTFCADTELLEPDASEFGEDKTVWFKFITPNIPGPNNVVNVNVFADNDMSYGDQVDLQLALWQSDAGCSSNFSEIISSYVNTDFYDEELNVCLKENTEYWIQVDGSDINSQGYFKLKVTNTGSTNGPINDDFCNATPLTIGTALNNESNECATIEIGEPIPSSTALGFQNAGNKSVWYSFIAPVSGRVNITVEDNDGFLSGIEPMWTLYDSDENCIGGNLTGNFNTLQSAYEILNTDAVADYRCLFPGKKYYIQVDGSLYDYGINYYNGTEGSFNIKVSDIYPSYTTVQSPNNNEYLNATNLAVQSSSCLFEVGSWSGQNYSEATRSIENNFCGNNCGDKWYKFSMPVIDTLSCTPSGGVNSFVKVEGNSNELIVAAYRLVSGNLQLIKCDGGSDKPEFSIMGLPNETIYLQTFSANGNSDDNNNFQVCVSERESSDNCIDALNAGDMDFGVAYCFNVRDATEDDLALPGIDGYEIDGSSGTPQKSVYYKFTTDDFCTGYELIINTNDLDEFENCGDGSSYSHLRYSIFYDSSPCDDNEDGKLLGLSFNDCPAANQPGLNERKRTFYVDNYGSIDGDSIPKNTTIIIQLEGSDGVIDGTIELRKICDGRMWHTVEAIGTTVSDTFCTDSKGWRHYYNNGGTDEFTGNTYPQYPNYWEDDTLLFSLDINNNFDLQGIASIEVLPTYVAAIDGNEAATYTMKRYWDFEITAGTIDPLKPVGIRFYYNQNEKQEIIDAAVSFASTHGLIVEPFEWFKTTNGVSFEPSMVHPRYIEDKQWSESGQFTANVFSVPPDGIIGSISPYDYAGPGQDFDDDAKNIWCNGVQYVELYGLTGFSGGTGAAGASDSLQSPLPVELLSFIGWNNGTVNELEWVTAIELNNDVFVVERSADAINFIEIGTVLGNGTTNEEHTYHFTDVTPIQGINYYRLKQIDFDGTFEYSSIIVVKVQNGLAKTAIIKLHPNPANELINIQLQSEFQTIFDITVLDLTGRVVDVLEMPALKGLNEPFSLEVKSYPQGVYLINLVDRISGNVYDVKFVKQ